MEVRAAVEVELAVEAEVDITPAVDVTAVAVALIKATARMVMVRPGKRIVALGLKMSAQWPLEIEVMELVPTRGHVPGLPWMNPPPVRVTEDMTMVHDAEEEEILDARDAWMEEHNNINPTIAFMTPTFGRLMERGLRGARVTGRSRVPGKPIKFKFKFKIPIPDNVDEALETLERHVIEENARSSQRPQIEGGQTGANSEWDSIRHQQDNAGYAGRGGMDVMRGPRGGRNGGAFRGRGAGRAQTQPFRDHHQAQRDQQLGQARGRGGAGGFRGRGRGGNRARHGPGEQQQRSAQTSRGQGLDHLEMDCAKGSNLGFDSTWCMHHQGRVYENGSQERSGALDRCIGMVLKHYRIEPRVVVRMVFDWITRNRSSRPEPRCVGADWHWANCIAIYVEQHPDVEVKAEMLPVRRNEVRERENNRWRDPSRTWTSFDFKDLARSKSAFQDSDWDTKGDRAELIKRLKGYAAAEPGIQPHFLKSEENEMASLVKLESYPDLHAELKNTVIKQEAMDEF